jgi:dTDP-D-glucose 4,6-dehydratase
VVGHGGGALRMLLSRKKWVLFGHGISIEQWLFIADWAVYTQIDGKSSQPLG